MDAPGESVAKVKSATMEVIDPMDHERAHSLGKRFRAIGCCSQIGSSAVGRAERSGRQSR